MTRAPTRRAVILALLLLAVAGATAAQEGIFEGAEPGEDGTETTLENAAPEFTNPERTIPEETAPQDEDGPEEPAEDDAERPEYGNEGPRGSGGGADGDSEGDAGWGQGKVLVCYKDKKTLTVGTPAEVAYPRHGDTPAPAAPRKPG